MVDRFLADSSRRACRDDIQNLLHEWEGQNVRLKLMLQSSFLLQEIEPLSEDLSKVAHLGLYALAAMQKGEKVALSQDDVDVLTRAAEPRADLLMAVVPAVRKLLDAAR
jgi:hypothetical protein